ncbi:MAG: hypothetical protein BMS9Abin33_1207 [Gammaproteobacteria bacterium]|nr:MAG: hypothetical protein BMS9Abin33_1207 [Gammaproteobacteria bacterium]
MSTNYWATFTLTFVLICSTPALYAKEDIQLLTGVSLNNKYSTFEYMGTELSPDYTTVNIEVIGFYKKMYMKVNYDQSIKDDIQSVGNGDFFYFSREDAALTWGYNVWGRLSVFTGLLAGKTEFPIITASGVDSFISELSYVGPFVGVSYGIPAGKGTLNVNFAFTSMQGKYSVSAFTSLLAETTGTTDGVSLGINWMRPINEGLNFIVGYKVNRFEFTDEDLAIGGIDFSTVDQMNIISFGFLTYFD